MGLFSRAIRPPDDITPNPNDPATAAPGTVGPPTAVPGDPHGVVIEGPDTPASPPPRVMPSAWSGWPADWWPPLWNNGQLDSLTDTAWSCLDLNSSVLASMAPYTVPVEPAADTGWLQNPNPDVYASWEEFAKSLFWDFMLGEVFVLATARYASGYPARFHVVPGWAVEVEVAAGVRRFKVGQIDVTGDMLQIRYQGSVDDARGHGPLEVGAGRMVADRVLSRYVSGFAGAGGIPTSVLNYPAEAGELMPEQAAKLKAEWVQARQSGIGEPAVLSGGITFEAMQANPKDMALVDLAQLTSSRIAVLLGVPPFLVGLPSGGDSMTYSNVNAIFDYHWRASLRPKAQAVMGALSGWLLPRGTVVELNRDAYVQPPPLERAQTAQIYAGIQDAQGNPVLSVEEIRAIERFRAAGVAGVPVPQGMVE